MSWSSLNTQTRNWVAPEDLGIDYKRLHYVAFFNGDVLDTRPIKLDNIYKMGRDDVLRVTWTYLFEVNKSIGGKISDKRLWKKLFGLDNSILEEKLTEGYEVNFKEDEEMIDFTLVGETPLMAKLKLCMVAQKIKNLDEHKAALIENELEYFREEQPDLLIKAMDWKIDEQTDDIPNYGKYFLSLNNDIRNN